MNLKPVLNIKEICTHKVLLESCNRHKCYVCPKMRVADVLPINNSGISDELFSYALKAHFDFIVVDLYYNPLFAVEFDGKGHIDSAQQEKDKKKNYLCHKFELPFIRIGSEYLNVVNRNMTVLTWLVECWFAYKYYSEEEEKGNIDYYDTFSPHDFSSIENIPKSFPLNLRGDSIGEIQELCIKGDIKDFMPTNKFWYDNNRSIYGISYICIDENKYAVSRVNLNSQGFVPQTWELLDDILDVKILEEVNSGLNGRVNTYTKEELNNILNEYSSLQEGILPF